MPKVSHFLQQGNTETDPVGICVRATGTEFVGEGIDKLIQRAEKLCANQAAVQVECIGPGHFCIMMLNPDRNGDYVYVYVNLNRLGTKHIDESQKEILEG